MFKAIPGRGGINWEACLAGLFLLAAALILSGQALPSAFSGPTQSAAEPIEAQGTPLVSPVSHFRRLLAMSATDVEKDLAQRPESQRKVLRAKIEEYQAMSATERDLRLKQVELRWYLVPLMHMNPPQRVSRLAAIPDDYRKIIQERLEQWDLLPPPIQKEALESEITRNYLLRLDSSTLTEREAMLKGLPTGRRKQIEQELARWQGLSPRQKQTRYSRFDDFFELNAQEKQKILSALSEAERLQMQNVLERFKNLPRDQRQHCIESFHKLASLTPDQQDEFLQNAERWQALSPAERESWREMVNALPPLPPGLFSADPISWPPLPQ